MDRGGNRDRKELRTFSPARDQLMRHSRLDLEGGRPIDGRQEALAALTALVEWADKN